MNLTKQKLYQLIKEAMVPDPDPAYASLYNPNQPMALLHMEPQPPFLQLQVLDTLLNIGWVKAWTIQVVLILQSP